MHPLMVAFVTVLVSGCAGLTTQKISEPQDRTNRVPATQTKETGQDAGVGISAPVIRDFAQAEPQSSAWAFLARALDTANPQAQLLLLAAAKRFLQTDRSEQAAVVLAQTQGENSEPWALNQHKLLTAALRLTENAPSAAWRLLSDTENTDLDKSQWQLLYDLKLQSLFAQEKHQEALALIRSLPLKDSVSADIDVLLRGVFDRLLRLTTEQLDLLQLHPDLVQEDRGWIDLARLYGRAGWELESLRQELDAWSVEHPAHHATPIARNLWPETCALAQSSQVALLLPMTSSFSKAASAFHDGVMYLHERERPSARPVITLYDLGADLEAVGAIYKEAIDAGADLVIGPLGRDAVSKLLADSKLLAPTLLLGPEDGRSKPNAFFVDLSRRIEARSLVTHARSRGLKHALVLHSPKPAHRVAANTAIQVWQQQGGIIADTAVLDPQLNDYSAIILRLLGLNQSRYRAEVLQKVLTDSLPVTVLPNIRQDLDVIFLFTDRGTARLFKPQIEFHHGGKLPIYSQNTIFEGMPDVVNDLDLEGVLFSDMPWLVRQTGRFGRSTEDVTTLTRYRGSAIDRLFALGMDSYRLGCHIPKRLDRPDWQYAGASGALSIDIDGRIKRHPDWARFRGGLPELFEPVIPR
ncbi:MAG: penicillin-binding protein activator [Proteobacteria bacterium]|nr:penicillin-binding protein activator [Pseudomonadota bacterium]